MRRAAICALLAALAGSLLAALAGCGGKVTELVLIVDSDIPAPSQVDAMHIVVTGPSGTDNFDGVEPYTGTAPLILGLIPHGSVLQPVTIVVEAEHLGSVIATRTITTGFDPGVSRVVHVRMALACLSQTCATGTSCDDTGTCVTNMVNAATLPVFTGTPSVPELCNGYDDDGDGTADDDFHFMTDPGHCGSCTNVCPAGEPCVSGICATSDVVHIAAGASHACALRRSGTLACWGDNLYGEIGTNDGLNHFLPTTVAGVSDAAAINAGYGLTVIRHMDGTLSCMGSNGFGESGQPGTTSNVTTPAHVPGVMGAVDADMGSVHACAVLGSGSVMCWGDSASGKLGNGATTGGTTAPTMVGGGLADALQISTGLDHTCAVQRSGHVVCWGANDRIQLGTASVTGMSGNPVLVDMLSGVTPGPQGQRALDLGAGFGCAIASGSVVCWGDNPGGQIGLAASTAWDPAMGPNHVGGVTAPTAVAVAPPGETNGCSGCAVLASGGVSCWGCNGSGQLGIGTAGTGSPMGQPVMGLANVVEIAVGSTFACALEMDGSVWCWGDNAAGQLGNGTTTASSVPMRVTAL